MYNNILIILVISFAFTSCFEKDKMVPAHEPGDVITAIIPMTKYYNSQVYFNLYQNEMVSIDDRDIFDLNFDCHDTSTVIRLNTASFALIAETEYQNLEDVFDTSNLVWKFDCSSGTIDSLAINNWITIDDGDTTYTNKVWVMDRGISPLGIRLGLIKIKFTALKANKYLFTYSNMDNTGVVNAVVEKNNEFILTQYSFATGLSQQIEPLKEDWDLLFTTYTTMLYTNEGLAYPYLVTGVLQKYNVVSAAFDTALIFDDISLADTSYLDFSYSFDKVGYSWKRLVGDVNTGNVYYEIEPNYNYIIKDANSLYYKLRFVNFYRPVSDSTPVEKGYPTFEYQVL